MSNKSYGSFIKCDLNFMQNHNKLVIIHSDFSADITDQIAMKQTERWTDATLPSCTKQKNCIKINSVHIVTSMKKDYTKKILKGSDDGV
jgi:hypothetical protein